MLPLLLPNGFYFDLVIRMAINAVVVLGLNLLIGFAGQISLGHAGFFGIGAYASAVLPTHFGWPPAAGHGRRGGLAPACWRPLVARPIFRLRATTWPWRRWGWASSCRIVLKNEAPRPAVRTACRCRR